MVERKSPAPYAMIARAIAAQVIWIGHPSGTVNSTMRDHGEKAERRETGAEPENEQHGEDDFSAAGQERPPSMVASRKPVTTRERALAFSCLAPSEPWLFDPDFATA